MARNVLLVSVGILLGVVGGAAFNIRAEEPNRDVHEAAAAAGYDEVELGAALTTLSRAGLPSDPWTYARFEGRLPPPRDSSRVTVWDRLVLCEASGNWHANTGNGFQGGLQFTPGTWHAYGGVGSPAQASREAQIAVAERVLVGQGWKAWPSCSRVLGLR